MYKLKNEQYKTKLSVDETIEKFDRHKFKKGALLEITGIALGSVGIMGITELGTTFENIGHHPFDYLFVPMLFVGRPLLTGLGVYLMCNS